MQKRYVYPADQEDELDAWDGIGVIAWMIGMAILGCIVLSLAAIAVYGLITGAIF
jgi:hypothetical protein